MKNVKNEVFYLTSKFIDNKSLESSPEEDFGFNYDDHSTFETLGDEPYNKSEAGLVEIDNLMRELETLKAKGANYVGCDWHCDHQELDLYGFSITPSTPEEMQGYLDALANRNKESKTKKIAELEKTLEILKKDL